MEKNVELEEWENAAIELNYHENVAMNYRLHYHPGLEVVFLFSGEMHLIVENEDILLRPGDIAVVPSLLVHGCRSDIVSDNVTIVFHDDLFLDVEHYMTFNAEYKISLLQGLAPSQHEILRDTLHEMTYLDAAGDHMMCLYYSKILLLHLLRIVMETDDAFAHVDMDYSQNQLMQRILQFVQKHYREKITLDTVATEIRVNKYMISKIINGKMKTSFTDLVNQYRILDVSHLLRHTDLSLPKIAELTGFSSVSAMYRNFRKTFHMSPKDYRSANQ